MQIVPSAWFGDLYIYPRLGMSQALSQSLFSPARFEIHHTMLMMLPFTWFEILDFPPFFLPRPTISHAFSSYTYIFKAPLVLLHLSVSPLTIRPIDINTSVTFDPLVLTLRSLRFHLATHARGSSPAFPTSVVAS